jgi:hypothetical protein
MEQFRGQLDLFKRPLVQAVANDCAQARKTILVLDRDEIDIFWGSGCLEKHCHLGRLQLLLNIGELREIEPFRKLRVEFVQLTRDELACQEVEVSKRMGGVPLAPFEGVGIGVAI